MRSGRAKINTEISAAIANWETAVGLEKGNVERKIKNIPEFFSSGLAPLDIKIYYKLTLIKIVGCRHRKDKHIKGTVSRVQKRTHEYTWI